MSYGAEQDVVKDPVCGMKVNPKKAVATIQHQGTTIYFCGKGCVAKFEADPDKYLKSKPDVPERRPSKAEQDTEYICPMDPEVKKMGPGSCPKCGLALEPATIVTPSTRMEYTCPMHPEIVRTSPGSCPKCGMALEPREGIAEETNPELIDMSRRFWISVALIVPLLALMVSEMLPSMPLQHLLSPGTWAWIEFALATPAVLWCGWPFFVRGWQSVANRSLNMFTLIALGTSAAYLYSVVATITPQVFPSSFRGMGGPVGLYFEPAAVIVTLVLLGQMMELRARSQTSSALRSLLGLTPKTAMEAGGITLLKGDLQAILRARRLSQATMSNIRQNLFFAFIYNAVGVPLAAGVLFPMFGILLNPMIAAAAMSFSSVSVIANSLRLRTTKL